QNQEELSIKFQSFSVSFSTVGLPKRTISTTSILTSVKHHRSSYPAISPSRPKLSQNDRIVLVTGASEGIGYAIAQSFGRAGAAKVIATGRRKGALDAAVASLSTSSPQTTFVGRVQDASAVANILDEEGVVVDVLVMNAASISAPGSILKLGYQAVLDDFATNVHEIAASAHCFYHQSKRDATAQSLINISTGAIHNFDIAAIKPNYSASKSAGTVLAQQIARGVSPDDMQVNSFHWMQSPLIRLEGTS
ncbi:hypothetical protein LLEC1_07232, partial [Akanthomyces lecanii]